MYNIYVFDRVGASARCKMSVTTNTANRVIHRYGFVLFSFRFFLIIIKNSQSYYYHITETINHKPGFRFPISGLPIDNAGKLLFYFIRRL